MKKKAIIAICLTIAVLACIAGLAQVAYAPTHWGGGRIDIKQVPANTPKIQECPWAWGGGRIDTKTMPI